MSSVAKLVAAITTVTATVCGPSTALAETRTPDRGFRGIKTVCLRVETLDLDVSTEALEEELTVRLRNAGVPMVGLDKCYESDGGAAVFVWLKAAPSPSGRLHAHEVDIVLYQDVVLERDLSCRVANATTWTHWSIGICETPSLDAMLRARAIELVDMFGKIFREENPRKTAKVLEKPAPG
jgi:hypothetical protein